MQTLKLIPGTKNYLANEKGEIWSSAIYGRRNKYRLKPCLNRHGDLVVGIYRKTRRVAELICETFAGRCPAGYTLFFIDGDHTNVNADNLLWMHPSSVSIKKISKLTDTAKPVPGYPGYFCTTAGDVISVKQRAARILKPTINEGGYHRVSLSGKAMYVQRIVFMTFHSPIPPGAEIRHLNNIKTDNRPENLAAGDHFQNNLDKVAHG